MTRFWMLVGVLLTLAGAATAQERYALVVGIDAYANVNPLLKARNDATAVQAALDAAGFDAHLVLDPTYVDMVRELSDFTGRLGPGDEAVFYFAGHGVQIDGRNYLLMSDVPAVGPDDALVLTSQSLAADVVLNEIRARGTRVVLLILDACRDNPFAQAGTRGIGDPDGGLAATEAPEGSFIMFSAGDGQTALDRLSDDDPDPNSVFTRSLLHYIDEPGLPVHEMARLVRSDVRALASTVGHPQFPAIYDQFDGSFQIMPGETAEPVAPVETAATDPCALALPLWQVIADSDDPAIVEEFIAGYGECAILRSLALDRLARITAPTLAAVPEPAPQDATADASRAVAVYPAEAEVVIVEKPVLSPDARASFDAFVATGYFGAFAIGDGGIWTYMTNTNSIDAARAIALSECATIDTGCRVVAEIRPHGFAEPEPGAITMSAAAAAMYVDPESDIGFYATAVSADGAYSKMWGFPSQVTADRAAVAECQKYRSQLGDYPCVLVPPAAD